MNCFSCFGSQKSRKSLSRKDGGGSSAAGKNDSKKPKPGEDSKKGPATNQPENENTAQTFTFRELATATRNFRQECLLGEGGFGKVFKGTLASTGQVVAVKQLDRNGMQGSKEFVVEVLMLSLLHHPNLVSLVGYCADGDQRLLVYEYMTGGSLEAHFLEVEKKQKTLDWQNRMKIAFGAAKGLEHLHDKANPPVVYRNLKPSNILLDEDLTPKLSDFGLSKLGFSGDNMPISSMVMGSNGYSAPEYGRGGQLTLKSDVYSFGVVFLELITGRRALDTNRPMDEQNLVDWAQPFFRDPKKFPDMADPLLNNKFPEKDLNQAVAIAAMCLQDEPAARPLMSDVVTALSFLTLSKTEIVDSPLPSSASAVIRAQGTNNEDNSNENGNKPNPNVSASSSYKSKSSKVLRDESGSSGDDSSSDSTHKEALIKRKSTKKSSRKSSMNSQRGKSMSRRSSRGSRKDAEYTSTKSRSRNGSSSSENNSMQGSEDESSGSDHNEE